MYQEYLNQLQMSIAPLSTEQLKDLLNDDEKIDQRTEDVLNDLKLQKEKLIEENRSKAEANLSKEPRVVELRTQVKELMEECKTNCSMVQEKMKDIKQKSGNVSQDTVLALLQTSAAESEESSDALVQKFKDSEVNIETFLDEFLNLRKTMHLRKIKSEKMQEILRQAKHNNSPAYGNMPASSGFFPRSPNSFNAAPGLPYPRAGPMMPMPPPLPPRPY